MILIYFGILGFGAIVIFLIFFSENQALQEKCESSLITYFHKISNTINEWEEKIDDFLLIKFRKPVSVTKINFPFPSAETKTVKEPETQQAPPDLIAEIPKSEEILSTAARMENQVSDNFDWQSRYGKLETLFQEKSLEFEKLEKALENEIKNRTEFDVIKEILETQITKNKEKYRQLQMELVIVQNEKEEYRSKIVQLENDILEKKRIIATQQEKINAITNTVSSTITI